MEKTNGRKSSILIVDDSEMNRSILSDMLGQEYHIIEVENGVQAIVELQKWGTEISLVMLDIIMPEMDGFDVLTIMNQCHWIEEIPVIMISSEQASSYVERAYELGVTDYISRPFDTLVVRRRVINTIMLYAKQKKLIEMVTDQIYQRQKNSNLMVSILSHIVEFRNKESGQHVLHIQAITDILLKALVKKTDRYHLTYTDISLIVTASALHDIGKISIPKSILNKPGKLTREEFSVIKTHCMAGAAMLEDLPFYRDEPLVRVAYAICRWHHERYDGKGYPDGLREEEIPIAAQIVSLADVYDALTSERVYKKAYSHPDALRMILDGECGTFNPLLLTCLTDAAGIIQTELQQDLLSSTNRHGIRNITEEMLHQQELAVSGRTLKLLEHERSKYEFLASISREILFEYTVRPPMITVSDGGAQRLGISKITMDPCNNCDVLNCINAKDIRHLGKMLRNTTPEDAVIQYECEAVLDGEVRWSRIVCRATWSEQDPPQYIGAIGKLLDIHEEYAQMLDLKYMAIHDTLTGLLNHKNAKKRIQDQLYNNPNTRFVLAIFDLDYFKAANDTYGHMFGDNVLKYMADRLLQCVRSDDIAARIGGDEFLFFLECKAEVQPVIDRIFKSLLGEYDGFPISISMGVASTCESGRQYDTLFRCADRALYQGKREGRGRYCFYESNGDMVNDGYNIGLMQTGETGCLSREGQL